MTNLEIFCVTNKQINSLKELNLKLVGVGTEDFDENYLTIECGDNIQKKERHYSELTFHYWFWKNKLSTYTDDVWIGFCQKRRFWMKNDKKINNLEELKDNLLTNIPLEWETNEVFLCEPIKVNYAKKMKMIKHGWRNLLKDPSIFFQNSKQNLKLQFDMFHGYGNLDKAINVLMPNEKNDFRKYVNTNTSFSPNIMFITKKRIMEKYFNSVFDWLFKCEDVFGFKTLKGYETGRLYAYLAERYMSYWFQKYHKVKYCNWVFYESF